MKNRGEFIAQLKEKLRNLTHDEVASAIAYYEEYFDDAGSENEQRVIMELDTPAEVASKIISEVTIKNLDGSKGTTIAGLNAIWVVTLGIFASPIALPLAIALVALVFSCVIVVLSFLLALAITAAALMAGAVVLLATSAVLIFSDFPTGLFFIGIAFIMGAGGMLLFTAIGFLSKIAINGIARGMAKVLKRGK